MTKAWNALTDSLRQLHPSRLASLVDRYPPAVTRDRSNRFFVHIRPETQGLGAQTTRVQGERIEGASDQHRPVRSGLAAGSPNSPETPCVNLAHETPRGLPVN